MKINVVRCLSVAFVLACVVSAVSANATTISGSASPGEATVPGSGSVDPFISFSAGGGTITGWADITVSGDTVTGITGSITDSDISSSPVAITGLSLYAGADNTFTYPGTWPYVTFGGLSFSTSEGDFNIASAPNIINDSKNNPVGYPLSPPNSYPLNYLTVPDGGTTLVLLGLAVAGLAGLRRKLSV